MSDTITPLDEILTADSRQQARVADIDEPRIKLLVLTLAGEPFAIRGEFVREVLPDHPVFFVPGCPPSLEGVINLRDEIETVIDLRRLLGLPPPPNLGETRILLVATAAMQSGVRVDRVDDVTDVVESAILPPPATLAAERKTVVKGVVRIGTQMATLLDIERLFQDYLDGRIG